MDATTLRRPKAAPFRLLLALASGTLAASLAHAEAWQVVPDLNIGLSMSDNASLSETERRNDAFLKLTPGVTISGRSGANFANLRASWDGELHLRDKTLNRGNLLANGSGTYDLYDRRLMVDGSINFSRQRLSVFGPSTDSAAYDPASQTMLRVYSLSPYLRWHWGEDTTGEARYKLTSSNATSEQVGRSTQNDFSVSVGNSATPSPLGWQLTAQDSVTFQSASQNVRVLSTRLYGIYAVDPLFHLRADTGYERNNYVASGKNSQVIYGGGFEWTPSPRTRFNAQVDRRFFGNGFNFELSWRGPRSALSASFSRDVTNSTAELGAADLLGLFSAYMNALKAQIPDDFERYLKAAQVWHDRGLPLGVGAGTTYMTRSYFLERRAQVTSSFSGARNSVGAAIHLSQRQRLVDPTLLMPGDDLARFAVIRESGVDLYASHLLSPLTTLNLTTGFSSSSGEASVDGAATHRRNLSLTATTKLGPKTDTSLSYRHDASRGATNYDANTVAANLGIQF